MGLFAAAAATVIVIVCEIVLLLVVSLATIVALYDPGVEDICPPKSPVVWPIVKPPVIADPVAAYSISFVLGLAVASKVTLLFSFWVKVWFEGATLQVGLFAAPPLLFPYLSYPASL